jgi:hypothetical protein
MWKKYLFLVIVLLFIAVIINIKYADLYTASGVKKELTLLKEFIYNPSLLSRFIIIQIIFPLIFVFEIFLIKYPFSKAVRILFVIQSVMAALGVYFTYFLMTFYVFQDAVQHHFNTNLIIAFECIFVILSFTLAISFINKSKVVNFYFSRKA